jgi:hypothetical protein
MGRCLAALLTSVAAATVVVQAGAVGESVDGFPNWEERVHNELANRARVDPAFEMSECGSPCAEAACYSPQPPLYYKRELNRAARFHAAHMELGDYFAHNSNCTLVQNIDQLYPAQCDGSASCSCVGGTPTCNPTCTGAGERVQLFNTNWSGEIIAGGSSPNQAFYLWLYEPTNDASCQFTQENGHRWLLLKADEAVGFGVEGRHVGDFGGDGEVHPIASGAHWPRQADPVEAWANWYDAAAPKAQRINVDGICTPLALTRGVAENGAYSANVGGVGSGCHRYFFLFIDAADQIVTFPETGSLGIGPDTCADWDTTRPPTGAGCECTPVCDGKTCGEDMCGGSCGNCAEGQSCDNGTCVGGGEGGSSTAASGSVSAGAGAASGSNDDVSSDDGLSGTCGCRMPKRAGAAGAWLLLIGLAIAAIRRRFG